MLTPLVPVKDWGWHRWRVRYWERDPDQYPDQQPLLEREFVESENGADSWVCGSADYPAEGGWPVARSGPQPAHATWEIVQENVGSTLRFRSGGRQGGTRVEGTGWCLAPPPGWLARGPG